MGDKCSTGLSLIASSNFNTKSSIPSLPTQHEKEKENKIAPKRKIITKGRKNDKKKGLIA